MPLPRRLTIVVALSTLTLGLAACDGGAGDEPAEGMRRVSGEWSRLDVPEEWVEVDSPEEWVATYQDEDRPDPAYQLRFSEHEGRTARELTADFYTPAQFGALPGFRNTPMEERPEWEQEEDEPEDYRNFHRARFTYDGEDGAEYESVLWGVADDDGNGVLVQLASTDLDEDLVRQIEDSIEITG